jgi:hypothetical protein
MNFDELKEAWSSEPVSGATLPEPAAGKTYSAVSIIRRHMRNEFTWTLIGYAGTLVYLVIASRSHLSFLILATGVFMFVQAGYYFTRFFLFYRRTARLDMSLLKSLRKFVYEMELNMEIYKTFSFCITPLACLLWLAIMDSLGKIGFVRVLACSDSAPSPRIIIWFVLTLAIAQVVGAFFQRLHLRMQYGRYVREIKGVLEDLEGE